MQLNDSLGVLPSERPPRRRHTTGDGLMRVVWFVPGIVSLGITGILAICLHGAIDHESRPAIKLFGGLTSVALGGTYLAFKRAFKRTWRQSIPRGGERTNRESSPPSLLETWNVTEDGIEALAARTGLPLALWASRLTTLSPDLARKLVGAGLPSDLDLNCLRSLSRESAEVLAQHNGPLSLNGLWTISAEAAEALSHHHGWLYLDGLIDLGPAVAGHLARHRHAVHLGDFYNRLSLNGVAELSKDTASALARFPGNLRLNGLKTLTHEVAQRLATHTADSVWGVAEMFPLLLDGVTTLSHESAAALANYTGGLSLDGLVRPSAEVLRSLAHHRGTALSLGRLVSMPDEVAVLFGSRTTPLLLPSLRDISPASLAALRRNPHVVLP